MRDPNRMYTVFEQFIEVWKKVPDWRFMQLISNFQHYIRSDGFYIEDDKIAEKLNEFVEVWVRPIER